MEGGWNPLFTLQFNGLELEAAERLLCLLILKSLVDGIEDKMSCMLTKDAVFSIKMMYKVIEPSFFQPFPLQMV